MIPPGMAGNKYSHASDQGNFPNPGDTASDTMQMGRMIATDVGNISFSSILTTDDNSGTSIIPPPAPSNPLIVPAIAPAIIYAIERFMVITPSSIFCNMESVYTKNPGPQTRVLNLLGKDIVGFQL